MYFNYLYNHNLSRIPPSMLGRSRAKMPVSPLCSGVIRGR